MTTLRCALLACALCLTFAAPAPASRDQESIFEDEHQLLDLGPVAANSAMDDIKSLGADSVRSLALWSRIAPAGSRRPRGFKAADPRAYAPGAWDPYDNMVRGLSVRGLGLILSPSTPMPAWASRCKKGKKATCKPDPKAYRAFVTALGTRYSGSYADENEGRAYVFHRDGDTWARRATLTADDGVSGGAGISALRAGCRNNGDPRQHNAERAKVRTAHSTH